MLLVYFLIIQCLLITPVFSMLTNVVTEFGMTPDQVAVMWMIGTAGEIIARAFFGQLTKIFETTQLYILWSTISTIQMVILCFNRSVHLFWVAIFMNGLAIGGSAGLKMVLIIEMIGIELQVRLNLKINYYILYYN